MVAGVVDQPVTGLSSFEAKKLCFVFTTHLAKRPSDLKQNGTQEKTQFSSTVFNTLSQGVPIHFVASASSKKHLLTG